MKIQSPRAFLARLARRRAARLSVSSLPALALGLGAALSGLQSVHAGTADTYTGSTNGNLLTATNWSLGTVPTIANDAIFASTLAASTARSITGGTLTVNSFNLLATTGAYGITNNSGATASTFILGGTGSTSNSTTGANAADLLYIAAGTETFTIANGAVAAATLTTSLGQSGNFDVGTSATLTISGALNLNAFTLTTTGAGTQNYSGAIGGTGSIVQSSTGVTTLSGTNTYSGGTSIRAGTVNVGATAGLGTAAVTLGNTTGSASAILALNLGTTGTIANNITLGGSATTPLTITATGATGTQTAGVNTTSSGTIGLNGSNLTITNQTATGTYRAANLIQTGAITGSGNLTVDVATTSSGTLQGGNTFIGGTTVTTNTSINNTGTLTLRNSSTTSATGAGGLATVTVNGGIGSNVGNITIANNAAITGSATSANAGTILVAGAVGNTGSITNQGTSVGGVTISGVINTANTGITQNSSTSALTLSGANTFTSNVTVTSGTLNANLDTAVSNPTNTALGNATTAGRTVTIGTGGTLAFTAGNVLGQASTNTTALSIIDNGGTFQVGTTSANLFNSLGNVTLNGGTMSLGNGNGTTYLTAGIEFGKTITVGGTSVSTIQALSGATSNVGINLATGTTTANSQVTFDVADATSSSASDLNVSVPLRNGGNTGTLATGLIKSSAGTMTLSGANTYTGPTNVNAGTLAFSTNASSIGAVTVADGAGLSSKAAAAATTPLTTTSLTLGTSGTTTLTFDFSNLNTTAALIATGAFTANGTVNVSLLNTGALTTGDHTLVSYTSFAGTGTFAPTSFTLSARSTGTLSNNGTNALVLTVASDNPVWTGAYSGDWTTATLPLPKNWKLATAGTPTDYIEGDIVVFDDTATGTTNVNISTANVSPSSTTFNNSTLNYTLSSTGGFGIAGTGGLTKTGSGTLTIGTANTYTGTTAINGGIVSVSADNNLGASAAAVSLNGGTLSTTAGFTDTHAFTIGASGGTINVNAGTGQLYFHTANTLLGSGPLTLTGSGTLTANSGNLRVDATNTYSGALTVNSGGIFEYGIAGAVGSTASLSVGNQGEISVNSGVTLPNAITISGGTNSVLSFENGTTGIYSGNITLNNNLTVGLRDWYNYATVRSGTISGIISGSGGLSVNSGTGTGGTLTLSGVNTFAGNISSTGSSNITVSGAGQLGSGTYAGNIAMTGGTFTISSTANQTLSGIISGTGALGKGAAGTLTLSNSNTYSGGTIIADNGGILAVTNGNALGSSTVQIGGGGSDTTGRLQLSNNITLATGTITIGGKTQGTVNTSARIENVSGNNAISANINFGLAGGTYANIFSTAGTLTLGGNLTAVTVTGTRVFEFAGSGNFLSNGIISNGSATVGLAKNGTGTLTLTGTNTYTGGTAVNTGLINVQNSSSLGTTDAVTVLVNAGVQLQGGITLPTGVTFTLSDDGTGTGPTYSIDNVSGNNAVNGAIAITSGSGGAAIQSDSGALTLAGNVSIAATGTGNKLLTLKGASTAANTVSGAISNNGASILSVTKDGAGTWALSGNNTYSGGTTLTLGQLNINSATALGTGAFTISAGSIDNTSGAAITLTNNNAQNWNGDFTFVGTNSLNMGTGAVTLNADRQVTVSANALSVGAVGGAFGLTKLGGGTLVLNGANTYTGNTNINAGTLVLAGDSTATTGQLIVNNAGILQFGNGMSGGSSVNSGTIFVNNTGTVQIYKSDGGTVSNQVASNPNAVTTLGGINGAGTTNTFTGVEYSNGGSFAINSANAGAILAFSGANPGAIDLKGTDLTVGGAGNTLFTSAGTGIYSSSGTSNVIKNGTGTLIFQGNQGYTGTTSINAGTVRVDATQTDTGRYFLGNGGTPGTAASLLLDGGTINPTGGVAFDGAITVNPGDGTNRTIGGTNTSGTNIFSGNIALDGNFGENRSANLTAATGGTVVFSGVISGAGQSITKTGGGTVILTGTDTYSGSTTISAGTLQLGNGTTDGSITASSNIMDNGALVYNRLGNFTYGNAISGTGTVTKTGTGRQTFTGANTYTGATTINGGTLEAASTTGQALGSTSSIAVNSGTLLLSQSNQLNTVAPVSLGVVSTSTGNVTVAAGASQGSAATANGGTVTGTTTQGLGALTLNNTATLTYGGASTTLVFNTFTPNGNVLTISGYTNANFNPSTMTSGSGTDDRLVFQGDQTGNFGNFDFGLGAGIGVGEVALDGGFYEVGLTPVPEPATWAAGALMLGVLGYSQRRQVRRWLGLVRGAQPV